MNFNISKSVQKCRLCTKRLANSKEHIPIQSSANKGKVKIIYVDSKVSSGEIKYSTYLSSDGFWLPVLCDKCNKKTGYRYGDAYRVFIDQINKSTGIEDVKNRVYMNFQQIYPLRILKQMLSMFLCSVPYQPAKEWKELQNFVLKRDTHLPKNSPYIYLYKNISKIGRIVPCCGVIEFFTSFEPITISEISWPPLGIIFSFQKDERFALMEEISYWNKYSFKDKVDLSLSLPQLKVCSHFPISYGNAEEVEREEGRKGRAYLFHVPSKSISPTNIGTILEPNR